MAIESEAPTLDTARLWDPCAMTPNSLCKSGVNRTTSLCICTLPSRHPGFRRSRTTYELYALLPSCFLSASRKPLPTDRGGIKGGSACLIQRLFTARVSRPTPRTLQAPTAPLQSSLQNSLSLSLSQATPPPSPNILAPHSSNKIATIAPFAGPQSPRRSHLPQRPFRRSCARPHRARFPRPATQGPVPDATSEGTRLQATALDPLDLVLIDVVHKLGRRLGLFPRDEDWAVGGDLRIRGQDLCHLPHPLLLDHKAVREVLGLHVKHLGVAS
ncbi:hypothetical protein T484DRAFT_1954117 [Baffinella frigidus]|nr:hypothetical protein T484DRAFT_1954117 [Cryptophyta sp. CCMP2293]